MTKLNGRVSSDITQLNKLKKLYWWIPGENNIRPSEDVIEEKEKFINNIYLKYTKLSDYILNVYFAFPTVLNSKGKLEVISRKNLPKKCLFKENEYPYQIEKGVNHYVLWYNFIPNNETDINNYIKTNIYQNIKHSNFTFIWYENPKMNISDIYHLHVFWIDNKIL